MRKGLRPCSSRPLPGFSNKQDVDKIKDLRLRRQLESFIAIRSMKNQPIANMTTRRSSWDVAANNVRVGMGYVDISGA